MVMDKNVINAPGCAWGVGEVLRKLYKC